MATNCMAGSVANQGVYDNGLHHLNNTGRNCDVGCPGDCPPGYLNCGDTLCCNFPVPHCCTSGGTCCGTTYCVTCTTCCELSQVCCIFVI